MSIAIPEERTARRTAAGAGLLLAAWTSAASAAPGIERLTLPTGLTAIIYTESYLRDRLEVHDGETVIDLDGVRSIPVITDIDDPAIQNKGDGAFHPFPRDLVVASLRAIDHPSLPLPVSVYILPFPRRGVLVSSTIGAEVFLSPHVLEVAPGVAAYIVTHEVGHAFHNRFLADSSSRWDEYRRLRGISDTSRFSETASHAYQPKEIFAEDFRVLFGGPEAYFGGGVENPELSSPEAVAGLEGFYVSVAGTTARPEPKVVVTSHPNPFNPETEIRVSVPPEFAQRAERVVLRVYAVTGALVRDLFSGDVTGDISVRWDGTDRAGNRVASGTYFASVEAHNARQTVKLVLLY